MNARQVLKNIEASVKGVSFRCPICDCEDSHKIMQTLASNNGFLYDIYACRCRACGYKFKVSSKPLMPYTKPIRGISIEAVQ